MSPILPIETIARQARAARCRRLPSGGGTAKSLRWGVRTKFFDAFADEGAGDHAPDIQGIAESTPDAAELVEPLEAETLLVRRDLEDQIGGRVADGLLPVLTCSSPNSSMIAVPEAWRLARMPGKLALP